MNFYISDMHLGHKNCIKYDNRPFENIDQMNKVLVENWNNKVSENDDIWIIGDFCYRSEKDPSYFLKQLKGHKHLIVGNHDKVTVESKSAYKYLESIEKLQHLKDGNHQVILCHFPLAEWAGKHYGSYHIHGHIHARTGETYEFMNRTERSLNAGCMLNGYEPVTFEELLRNNMLFRESQKLEEMVYLLCIQSYEETDIFGVYSDKRKLLEDYDQLMEKDARCRALESENLRNYIHEEPVIYAFKKNKFYADFQDFLGEDSRFYDMCMELEVSYEEIKEEIL